MTFSDTLLDHFESPRNVGEMDGADAEAEDENPVCGDRLHMWLRIRAGTIQDVKWRAQGCVPAIAAASVASELVRNSTLEEASAIDHLTISDALGGIPPRKSHAAILAASVIRKAIEQYGTRGDSRAS